AVDRACARSAGDAMSKRLSQRLARFGSLRQGGVLVVLFLGSCAGLELEGQVKGIRNLTKQARENGAYKCAPHELALAEANSDFADNELHQGDYFRAREHVKIADENARLAIANSPREKCAPQVVVLGPRDTDGDGITDDKD